MNGNSEGREERRNSARFLDAFVQIESALRRITGSSSAQSFAAMLAEASRTRAYVRRFRSDLQRYADLRNAIVHERQGRTEAIAEPHDGTVAELEGVAAVISAPPKLEQLPPVAVSICAPTDSVLQVATTMSTGRFSQLPVYDGDDCIGLVTSATIARWLAVKLGEEGGVLDDCPVSDVLPYREDSSIHHFMARQDTVADAIEVFESAANDGKYLDAVIVTQTGRPNQKPINILTVFDLPRLGRLATGGAP